MTVNDLLKRIDKSDYDKVIVVSDGIGWTNVSGKIVVNESGGTITLFNDYSRPFSND